MRLDRMATVFMNLREIIGYVFLITRNIQSDLDMQENNIFRQKGMLFFREHPILQLGILKIYKFWHISAIVTFLTNNIRESNVRLKSILYLISQRSYQLKLIFNVAKFSLYHCKKIKL